MYNKNTVKVGNEVYTFLNSFMSWKRVVEVKEDCVIVDFLNEGILIPVKYTEIFGIR